MIQIDIPMPTNCEECDERGIRQLLWCRLIHSGCANCGRHPNCPLKEVPSGKWIENAPQYDMLNPQYVCSECGNAHTRITPYCENCGAKMVEPQESEDA